MKIKHWKTAAWAALAVVFCFGCGSRQEEFLLETVSAQEPFPAGQAPDLEDAGSGEETLEETQTEAESLAVWVVHVCGAVNAPGVYELPEGSRICDAVQLAGGFSEDAAQDALNLAQPLEDGMKVEIPTGEEAERAIAAAVESGVWEPEWIKLGTAEKAGEASGASKININTAREEELTRLSGIGEARAKDIIAYREANGPFRTAEEIMQVPGIKEAVFQKIKEEITVSER